MKRGPWTINETDTLGNAQALATWSMRREMSELGVGVGG